MNIYQRKLYSIMNTCIKYIENKEYIYKNDEMTYRQFNIKFRKIFTSLGNKFILNNSNDIIFTEFIDKFIKEFCKNNSQDGYRIYSEDYENWYATRLNYADTLTAISEFEEISEDDIYLEECNIDKDGMWYPVDEKKIDTTDGSKYQVFEGQLEEYISFREALKRIKNETEEWYDYGKDVFMISTSIR